MRNEIWIYGMDITFKTLVRWHLCITKSNIEFIADAATRAMKWAQSHKVQNGRYEVHVLMLTPEQHDTIKPILTALMNGTLPAVAPAPLPPIALEPPSQELRAILKLKRLRLSDNEVTLKLPVSKYAVEKALYRARLFYGVGSTPELIDLLEAAGLL
ncbi:MAG: hypothetical protein ABIT08_10225 [Bacteroidia bacterium]